MSIAKTSELSKLHFEPNFPPSECVSLARNPSRIATITSEQPANNRQVSGTAITKLPSVPLHPARAHQRNILSLGESLPPMETPGKPMMERLATKRFCGGLVDLQRGSVTKVSNAGSIVFDGTIDNREYKAHTGAIFAPSTGTYVHTYIHTLRIHCTWARVQPYACPRYVVCVCPRASVRARYLP